MTISADLFSKLPCLNATLNFLSATLLVLGFVFIRRKNIEAHKKCMLGAVTASVIFLISYLTYHYRYGTTVFRGQGWHRTLYLSILISHMCLAVLIIPLVIVTFVHALRGRIDRHKRIARLTLPIWLYVSITGVLVYLMLYHIFKI